MGGVLSSPQTQHVLSHYRAFVGITSLMPGAASPGSDLHSVGFQGLESPLMAFPQNSLAKASSLSSALLVPSNSTFCT